MFALKQAIALVREGLVFGILGLMYCQVDNVCRRLFRFISDSTSKFSFHEPFGARNFKRTS